MRIAVIADIHGNLPALEVVLAGIERRGVDQTINLGDCVSGPLWPREVCDLLMASDHLTIRGNYDRWVSAPNLKPIGASDRYAPSQLAQIIVAGSSNYRPRLMQPMASSPRLRMTISTSGIQVQKADAVLLKRATGHDAAEIADLYLASRVDALPYLRRVHTDDQVRGWILNVLLRRG